MHPACSGASSGPCVNGQQQARPVAQSVIFLPFYIIHALRQQHSSNERPFNQLVRTLGTVVCLHITKYPFLTDDLGPLRGNLQKVMPGMMPTLLEDVLEWAERYVSLKQVFGISIDYRPFHVDATGYEVLRIHARSLIKTFETWRRSVGKEPTSLQVHILCHLLLRDLAQAVQLMIPANCMIDPSWSVVSAQFLQLMARYTDLQEYVPRVTLKLDPFPLLTCYALTCNIHVSILCAACKVRYVRFFENEPARVDLISDAIRSIYAPVPTMAVDSDWHGMMQDHLMDALLSSYIRGKLALERCYRVGPSQDTVGQQVAISAYELYHAVLHCPWSPSGPSFQLRLSNLGADVHPSKDLLMAQLRILLQLSTFRDYLQADSQLHAWVKRFRSNYKIQTSRLFAHHPSKLCTYFAQVLEIMLNNLDAISAVSLTNAVTGHLYSSKDDYPLWRHVMIRQLQRRQVSSKIIEAL